MDTLVGLIMLTGQVMGIAIIFGGRKKCPHRLRICIGICMILIIVGIFGMAEKM